MRQRLLFLLLLMAVALPPCLGQSKQKFSVVSFALDPYDLTAQSEQHRRTDSSGALYAIVKVSSTNPDDDLRDYRFSFGLLKHEVVEHDGELWLYVQRNAKTVTISREGFQTVSKFDLKTTIEAGKTYVMQLSASARPVYTQMVQFVVKPVGVGATVTIKSTKRDATKELLGPVDAMGTIARALEYGSYTYEILAPNYHPSEGRIDLNDRMKTHVETVTLRPNFSEMTLRVDADADIYVNGERKGRRTWSGVLKAGNYNVECRQPNHRSSTQYITVAENDNRTINLTPPAPITGALAVTSRPSGASITIDGRNYGITPRQIPDLLIGSHRVTLAHANYKTESREVTVSENETAQLDVALSDMIRMTIDSHPTGASLTIDGRDVGLTPYSAEMSSGDYDVRLTKQGWHDLAKRIHLDGSQPQTTIRMSRQLQKPSAFYIQAGAQVGTMMGVGAAVGCFLGNFNVEAGYTLGLGKSEDLTGSYTVNNTFFSVDGQFKASAITARIGYGFLVGSRTRVAPQVGVNHVMIKDSYALFEPYVDCATIGARVSYAVASSLELFATPEVNVAVVKSGEFKLFNPISSKIKGWGTGFNIRAGLAVFF